MIELRRNAILPTGHWLLLLVVAIVAGGCGKTNDSTVTGLVTLDGKPLNGGNVWFVSDGGGTVAAAGAIDSSGRYQLKTPAGPGLIAGKYKVMVKPDEAKPESNAIPRVYSSTGTTPLKFTVAAGENDRPLHLKH